MASNLPEPGESLRRASEARSFLHDALEGLLEFTGAGAGWVGFRKAEGLVFPARLGPIPETWLTLQQGHGDVWGFEVREGPTLINDLRPLPSLGSPPLRSLLSCPLGPPAPDEAPPRGHIVLANKPNGFTSHDATLLQGVAHLLYRQLLQQEEQSGRPASLGADLLARILDRVDEGALIVDARGRLLYANAVWLRWTGFSAEELLAAQAPFPFWIGHQELAGMGRLADASFPDDILPFRRRDNSLFWCRVQSTRENDPKYPITVALLRPADVPVDAAASEHPQAPAAAPPSPETGANEARQPRPSWLLLRLEPGREVSGWGPRWEQLTGLSATDVAGTPTEVVLDLLFPQQKDREQVADWMNQAERVGGQARLAVLAGGSQRPVLCTLLPLPPTPGATEGRALPWLLLVAELAPASEGVPGAESSDTLRAHAPTEAPGPHTRPTRHTAEQEPPA